jgi:hypothetical protein
MRTTPQVVLIASAIIGCGCEAPRSPVEAVEQPIVAGMPDPGDPAIMELLSNKGNLWARCTATLVTPRVLLTAAHCFVETPGFRRAVFPGNDDRNFTEKDLLPLEATAYDPDYRVARQGHDFGIVVLASPLPIPPLRINRAPIDKAQGKIIRYVGYGLVNGRDPNSGGLKRTATAPIADVSSILIAVAPNAHGSCQGDSGGPMLLDDGTGESIIGVTSFIDNSACIRDTFYQRVDTQLAWVDQQLAKYAANGPAPAGDGGAPDARAPDRADSGAPDAATSPAPRLDAAAAPQGMRDAAAPRDLAPEDDPEPEPDPAGRPGVNRGGSGGCALGGADAPAATWMAAALSAVVYLARRRRLPPDWR